MTTELKPGTPEYDEAYQKEMQRLEAEAAKDGKKDDAEAATNTSEAKDEPKGDAKANDGKTETADELKARLDEEKAARERLEKSLKDTQRWAHQNAARVKKLEREAEERKHRETLADDPLIKANPGLEETIKRVTGTKANEQPAPQEQWLSSVAKAIPDVETLLSDQAFFAKAKAKQVEVGPEWDDPFVAIRELSELKASHLSEKRAQAAVEAARKDFETKKNKRNAMEVPGGSGGKDSQTQVDEAQRIHSMSKKDFDAMRAKVKGY